MSVHVRAITPFPSNDSGRSKGVSQRPIYGGLVCGLTSLLGLPLHSRRSAAFSGFGRGDVGGRRRWSTAPAGRSPISSRAISAYGSGFARRVVSAEWVSLVTPERPGAPPPPAGYSTNENATGGRLIVFVVDQPNIRFGGAMGIRAAVNGFLDRLQPSDRVAAVGVGPGSASTKFTADRERVKQTIARTVGQGSARSFGQYQIALSEARGASRRHLYARPADCPRVRDEPPDSRWNSVRKRGAGGRTDGVRGHRQRRADDRHVRVAAGLKTIDVPKTVVLVTEGIVLDDQRASPGSSATWPRPPGRVSMP